jgi:very-short-patch-repair endonuclease/intein/homing endonuclease
MSVPIIQTANLDETFNALKNQDPRKLNNLPSRRPDYKSIPNQNFAPTTSVSGAFNSGMNRFASSSGGGNGIVYGQPQFFSPVHTPINWQIPSKRLEEYQWCLAPWMKVLCEDFTYKPISDLSIGEKVLTHDGTMRSIEKIGIRKINENIYKIKIQSERDLLEITGNHKVYCVKSEDIACKYKLNNKRPQKCTPLFDIPCATYPKNNNPKCQKDKLNISHLPVSELKENDYLLFPVPTKVIDIPEMTVGKARLLGYYAAEGCGFLDPQKSIYFTKFTLNIDEKNTLAKEICDLLKQEFNAKPYTYVWEKRPNTLSVKCQSKEVLSFFKKYCPGKAKFKELHNDILYINPLLQKHIIACYISGDGHFHIKDNKATEASMCSASESLLEQIRIMLSRNNIATTELGYHLSKLSYKGIVKSFDTYTLAMSESSINKMGNIFCEKEKNIENRQYNSKNNCVIKDGYILKRINKIDIENYNGDVYNLEVKDNHSYVVNGILVHNCRFFYQNEAKVASAIDFYSYFPMSNFENDCKDRNIKRYFDKLKNRLELPKWLRLISHEMHLLGDCFPFIEVSCEHCGGSGRNGDELCEHQGGTVRRIVILNPDYVEVHSGPMSPEPIIALKPDDELMNMVQKKTPGYDRLTPEVRALVSSGRPIRLDNRNVHHLMYGESGYARYGIGMVRRLFPILSYKTKLMVAQWIVAERLIVPIKIVKVGSDDRPAGPADIAAVQEQLAQTANDPNLTIVTHHAFELDFIGSSGKVLTLSNEFELINQEILDGLMINNSLLNGEGPAFQSAAVGIEAMIKRLETFREEISNWVEQQIYLPEAIRQGFIDPNAESEEEEYIYPKIKWPEMQLRDQQQTRTFILQLYEKGLLSVQTVLENFNFDPDKEIERKRYDAIQQMAMGQGMDASGGPAGGGGFGGGGAGMPPMGGMGGDLGGGMPGGGMGGDLGGGMPGGDTGGTPPISAPPAGGAPMASSNRMIVEAQVQSNSADPSAYGGKVLKKKTRDKIDSQKQKMYKHKPQGQQSQPMTGMRDLKGRIVFTKCERQIMDKLVEYKSNGLINYPVVPQFEVKYGSVTYPIDFALPHLKIGIEADGEAFHSSPKQITHDKERDQKLAQVGWTILRFTDTEIEKQVERVMSTVLKTIMQKEQLLNKQKNLLNK